MHITTTSILGLLAAAAAAAPQSAGVPKGKKVQWMGHSFHWFLPQPVADLAKEAGIVGHETLGVDRIGASLPCQHWNKGGADGTNAVKDMLKSGRADVLTIATRELAPDECIPKFASLGAKYRKDMHVMVQETWLPQSADATLEGCQDWGCSNRDIADVNLLEKTRTTLEVPYRGRLKGQLEGINKEMGVNLTTMVPLWSAVLQMREMIVKGEIPGVPKQSSLFVDNLGHAQKPLKDMASYMWFGAMYGLTPIGSQVLAEGTPAGQAAVLQKLAWDTLKSDGLGNGVTP